MTELDTQRAAQIAQATVDIVAAGAYVAPSGREVVIGPHVQRAVAGTRQYDPDVVLAAPVARFQATPIAVTGETTLAAARRLAESGAATCALNFASARNPGGGFLVGALAQEESLCRASALYACLEPQPMYAYHRMQRDFMYSDRVVFAPAVPVFRDDDGALLEAPYQVAFISAPAINATGVIERDPRAEATIAPAMTARAARVLAVAAAHGAEALVLGAWGCGVFGNRPEVVAEAFGAALEGAFRGVFAEVVFAIVEAPGGRRRAAFEARFG